jgi:deoxyribose-phosphate aldolase
MPSPATLDRLNPLDKDRIIKLIDEVLKETNAHLCCENGVCSDNLCVVHNQTGVRSILQGGADRITAGIGLKAGNFDLSLARMIDHTLLKPEATKQQVEELCAEAKQYSFASVCINPSFVKLCAQLLRGTSVKVCTVIGFPLGSTSTEAKTFEADQALRDGARELDMVLNVGMLKSGENHYVENDIRSVAQAVHRSGALLKVIIETGLLTDEEKIRACVLAKRAGADFVKTSTGFSKGGATAGDIRLMRKVVGSGLGVKASGGVRTQEQALELIESGADRIGASASVKIVMGEKEAGGGNY